MKVIPCECSWWTWGLALVSLVVAFAAFTKGIWWQTSWEVKTLDDNDPIKIKLRTLPINTAFKVPVKGELPNTVSWDDIRITLSDGRLLSVNRIYDLGFGAVTLSCDSYDNSYIENSASCFALTVRYSAIVSVEMKTITQAC